MIDGDQVFHALIFTEMWRGVIIIVEKWHDGSYVPFTGKEKIWSYECREKRRRGRKNEGEKMKTEERETRKIIGVIDVNNLGCIWSSANPQWQLAPARLVTVG